MKHPAPIKVETTMENLQKAGVKIEERPMTSLMIAAETKTTNVDPKKLPAPSAKGSILFLATKLIAGDGSISAYKFAIKVAAPGAALWDDLGTVQCDGSEVEKVIKSQKVEGLVSSLNQWLQTGVERACDAANDALYLWLSFRAIARSELAALINSIAQGRIVHTYRMEGSDLATAQRVLTKHFPLIDRDLQVLFLFRREEVKGEPKFWNAGKDRDGHEVRKVAECRKVGSAQQDVYLSAFGFSPDFVITFDETAWADLEFDERLFYIHHELSHIGYNPDKKAKWIAAHDLEEFGAVLERFKPSVWPGSRRRFIDAALAGAVKFEQLTLFPAMKSPVTAAAN